MASSEDVNLPLRTLAWTNCSRSAGKMGVHIGHLLRFFSLPGRPDIVEPDV